MIVLVIGFVGCDLVRVFDVGGFLVEGHFVKGDCGEEVEILIVFVLVVLVELVEMGEIDLQWVLVVQIIVCIEVGDVWFGDVDEVKGADLWYMCMDFMFGECGECFMDEYWVGIEVF